MRASNIPQRPCPSLAPPSGGVGTCSRCRHFDTPPAFEESIGEKKASKSGKKSSVVHSLEYQIEAALNVYCMPEMLAQNACTHALHLLSDTHGALEYKTSLAEAYARPMIYQLTFPRW